MAYSLYLEATAIKKQATKLSRHWLWILPSFFLTHALWAKHPGGVLFLRSVPSTLASGKTCDKIEWSLSLR